YVFRFNAYATGCGKEPLKVNVTVDGKIVKTLEFAEGDPKKATEPLVPVTLEKGDRRIAVNFSNPFKDDKGVERTLHIENFHLAGPADTRPETHRKLLACDASKPKHEQAVEILKRFASRAYRRPATNDEVNRLVNLAEAIQ